MILPTTRAPSAPGHAALRAMFAARKQVFVDLLKWDVPVLDERYEVDQFDTPEARYLILLDNEGRHHASARLLPLSDRICSAIFIPIFAKAIFRQARPFGRSAASAWTVTCVSRVSTNGTDLRL